MEFGVLGPLELRDGERPVPLVAPRLHTLLAVLLVRANQVVPAGCLTDEIWTGESPRSPAGLLHVHVSHLRKLLRPAGAPADPDPPLVTRPGGYLLRLEPGQLDHDRFERLVAAGQEAVAGGMPERASGALREALALWRGPALADVASRSIVPSASIRLEEQRLAALEERIEADLALGRHAALGSELRALIATSPLRERLHGQLMLALYRSGRQAEALGAYSGARQTLVEELGIDPGPALQRLQRAILANDPALDLGPAAGPPVRLAPSVSIAPCQLPPDLADFTGRGEELAWIRDVLARGPGENGTAVPIAAVAGKAGVGKTALAVRAAHQLRACFPDGQLYVNLRGAEAEPLDPAAVLADFLRAFGAEGAGAPEDLQARSRRYRARLAGRRVLVVLARELGDAPGVASALCGIGAVHHAHGRHGEAVACYRRALPMFRDAGIALWEGRALAIFHRVGAPEATEVQALLDG